MRDSVIVQQHGDVTAFERRDVESVNSICRPDAELADAYRLLARAETENQGEVRR